MQYIIVTDEKGNPSYQMLNDNNEVINVNNANKVPQATPDNLGGIKAEFRTTQNNPVVIDAETGFAYTADNGGSGGTANHAGLYNLAFDNSSHTGFQRELTAQQLANINNVPSKANQSSLDALQLIAESALQPDDLAAWAKSPTKPTYTANEVNALPANTQIPTNLSQLSNTDTQFQSATDIATAIQTHNNAADAHGINAVKQQLDNTYTKTQSDAKYQTILTVEQLENLAEVGNKVDKVEGYGLSQADYTPAEKQKLAVMEYHFKGRFTSLVDLNTVIGKAGDEAILAIPDTDEVQYIWSVSDNMWQANTATATGETAESIKQKYESNPDTNAFTDAYKTQLDAGTVNTTQFTTYQGTISAEFTRIDEEIADLTGGGVTEAQLTAAVTTHNTSETTHEDIRTALQAIETSSVTQEDISTAVNTHNDNDTSHTDIRTLIGNKVSSEVGKGLSTNDYTTTDKNAVTASVNTITVGTTSYSVEAGTHNVILPDFATALALEDYTPTTEINTLIENSVDTAVTAELATYPTTEQMNTAITTAIGTALQASY